MKTKLFFLFLFITFVIPKIEALTRDVENYSNEHESYFCHDCVKWFKYFEKKSVWKDIDAHLHLIPTSNGKQCDRCLMLGHKREGIYAPYISWSSCDNFHLLQDYLLYCTNNNLCQCYWPEKNKEAANLSDLAFKLFGELFNSTALSILVKNKEEQKLYCCLNRVMQKNFPIKA